ncbi:MAG: type II toxin-antitoxin system VapC family toxin [Terriglobales bacterium]
MAAIYLDSSAAVALILDEPGAVALGEFLQLWSEPVSSALARVETIRAVNRAPSSERRVRALALLARLSLISISNEIVEHAAQLTPAKLRSLDAVHVATALSIPRLGGMVVYDQRLAEAAEANGLRVFMPGR